VVKEDSQPAPDKQAGRPIMSREVPHEADLQNRLRTQLAARIGLRRFQLWFGSHTRFLIEDHCLTICTASVFLRDWLQQNFSRDMHSCCVEVLGRELKIEFEIDASLLLPTDAENGKTEKERALQLPKMPSLEKELASKNLVPADLVPPEAAVEDRPTRPEANFAAFVIGKSNEYAARAAQMSARNLQQASPLLFRGPPGVGKTHLLRAIRNEHQRYHPRGRAIYLTAEQFTTNFIEAIRGSGLPSFRRKCRGADLLMIDDIHFFSGKRATLEELLHTVDAQLAEGAQIVFASDRSLAELRPLGQELVSRLMGGLICEIGQPERSTRLGILRQMCMEMKMEVEEEVLSAIATRITASPRELRGALHRLQATSLAFDRPISRELAEGALTEIVQQCTRPVRLPDVQKAVCDIFGVEPASLRSDRKTRSVSEPRMLAMWLARKHTRAPWSEIGRFFGRRSHSTVISAHRRVDQLLTRQAEIGVSDQACSVEEAIRRVEEALRTA